MIAPRDGAFEQEADRDVAGVSGGPCADRMAEAAVVQALAADGCLTSSCLLVWEDSRGGSAL
ncbi:hypothetical protein T261_08736 [Streptomyces lydicus]|nr:hypothetical protein T261_08736 [Streptomyces lydicus]